LSLRIKSKGKAPKSVKPKPQLFHVRKR
jgi:hypothetical protein